jgi:hypothetical protein
MPVKVASILPEFLISIGLLAPSVSALMPMSGSMMPLLIMVSGLLLP